MGMPLPESLTKRQAQWFAAVQDGLQRETGRTMDEWIAMARACPETAHRKRLAWMKAEHGLGQNRASLVLNAAFPPEASGSTPETLADRLWADPAARAIHDAVHAAATTLPEVIVGQRKGYTAFSRQFQFAAIKPVKGGVLLGLAVPAECDAALEPSGKDGWSERLLSRTRLPDAAALTASLLRALQTAWQRS